MKLRATGWQTYVYTLQSASNPGSHIVEAIGAMYYSQGNMPREPLLGLFGHIYVIYEALEVSRLAFEMLKILGPNGVFII